MLMPKKTKYRKMHTGRLVGRAKGGTTLAIGDFGLVAVESSWLTARQIEAVRVTLSRKLKKIGELHLRVFPDKPVTKKPAETRMGKGKGNPEFWVSVVKRGRIIIEISGNLTKEQAKEILHAASYKLPMKTRFVSKADEIAAAAVVRTEGSLSTSVVA